MRQTTAKLNVHFQIDSSSAGTFRRPHRNHIQHSSTPVQNTANHITFSTLLDQYKTQLTMSHAKGLLHQFKTQPTKSHTKGLLHQFKTQLTISHAKGLLHQFKTQLTISQTKGLLN